MPAYRPLTERFWEKVSRRPTGDECWRWTASVTRDGYGTIGIGHGRSDLAHRVAWRMTYGDIPPGVEVCHRCDVPACVRPDHLFLGTHGDNVRDCATKGRLRGHRFPKGERHRMAKLSAADVEHVRAAHGTQFEIGQRFGISQAQVSRIRSGRRWT